MKGILIIPLFFMLIVSYAQNDDPINKLIQTAKEGISQKKEVAFDNSTNGLQVGEYIIPVSQNTLVKVEVENGKYEVEFSLQKGTTVKNTLDPNWKRASFALSFKSQKAAKDFIRLFQDVIEKESIN
jgi:2-phospho-L-lactate transferase/gluconeogenesis factor (CofD/UPF0052 family)